MRAFRIWATAVVLLLSGLVWSTPVAASAAATPTAVCAATGETGMQSGSIAVNGTTRSYSVFVPQSWDGTRSVPVVYLFHGRYGQAVDQLWASGLWRYAQQHGFIVVAPQAAGDPIDWDLNTSTDADFVLALQAEIAGQWCVDTARQYAAGYSAGSAVTQALACYGIGTFEGYSGAAGQRWPGGCTNTAGFDFVYFHGTADAYAPYNGEGSIQSVQWAMYQLAAFDGCSTHDPDTATAVGTDVTRYTWTTCTNGRHVDVYVMNGAGHVWPGAEYIAGLGPQPASLDASEVLVATWSLAGP